MLEALRRILKKANSTSRFSLDDFVELETINLENTTSITRFVKVCKLKGYADIEKVSKELNSGNIVIADIRNLAIRSENELKYAIKEMKRIVEMINGDIAGISENHLIITPSGIKIDRTKEESREKEFEKTIEKIREKMKQE